MSIATAADGIRTLAVEQLQVSHTRSQDERRKHFDKDAIAELADSIKEVGLLSPIIARAVNGHFEVVAGERRLLAVRKAGITAISVDVRTLNDEQVLKIQLVENLQREGLHELAEAEGYEALQKLGYSAEQIAGEVGNSKAYVYARMKLLALGQDARKGFYEGKISASVALLIARIPGDADQKKAFDHILRPFEWRPNESLNYRDAQNYVHDNFMLKLSQAQFPRDDASLVPAAGACGACPKRTGNNPDLFGDVKGADVCTDPACFKSKNAAFNKLQVAKAKETGQPIITGAAARKAQSPYSSHLSGYVRPGDKCPEDPKKRTYAQLLGKTDVESSLLQNPQNGKFSKVYKTTDVAKALKDHGIKVHVDDREANSKAMNTKWKAEEAKRDAKRAHNRLILKAVIGAVKPKLGREDLELVAAEMLQNGYYDGTFEMLGIKRSQKDLSALSDLDLNKVLVGLALASDSDDGYREPKTLLAAAKRYGVDLKKATAQAAPPAAAVKPAKKKAKAKKK